METELMIHTLQNTLIGCCSRSLVIFLTEIEQAEASIQLIQAMQLLRSKHHILVAFN